jgi:hypothetical protein
MLIRQKSDLSKIKTSCESWAHIFSLSCGIFGFDVVYNVVVVVFLVCKIFCQLQLGIFLLDLLHCVDFIDIFIDIFIDLSS